MERRTILKALVSLFVLPFGWLASVLTRERVPDWYPDAKPITFPTGGGWGEYRRYQDAVFNPEDYEGSLLPNPAPRYRQLFSTPANGEFRYAMVWEGGTSELRHIGSGKMPYTMPKLPGMWVCRKFEDLWAGDLCCLIEGDGTRKDIRFFRVDRAARPYVPSTWYPDVGVDLTPMGIIA